MGRIRRLQAEHKRLTDRLHGMYLDKLDGRVTPQFFDDMAGQWREEQQRCLRDIERHQTAEQSYMVEGIKLLELANDAKGLFERQPAREKRRLLNLLLSNCEWSDGVIAVTFQQPFDFLIKTRVADTVPENSGGLETAKNQVWLGD